MKKTFALLLSLAILAAVFPASFLHVSAADTSASAFKFDAETGTITDLTYECKALTELVIPAEINGVAVTKIGICAFAWCESLTSVTMGNNVTEIGEGAFSGCTSLTTVTIPNSVTTICSSAFDNCNNLQYNIYDNAKYLGNETNPYVVLMKAKDQKITACEIHPNTKLMYDYAFSDCKSLTNITILDSVTEIGWGVFQHCTSLTSVTIPDSVKSIGWYAFEDCTSLTTVTIPNSVTEIGYKAFRGCTSLTSVTIPDSVTEIGDCAFRGCTSLTSVTMSDSVTKINGDAFRGCTSLTSMSIPDSVIYIGYDAFSNCTSLKKIYIPKGCQMPVKKMLDGCIELTDVYYGGTQAQWYNISKDFNPYIKIHLNSSEKEFRKKYDKSENNVGAVVAIVVSVLVLAVVVAAVVVKKRKARQQVSSEGVVPSQDAPDSHTAADAQDGVATQLCPNCGYRLSGDSVYCPKCGKKLC